jgi:hypothetical protein
MPRLQHLVCAGLASAALLVGASTASAERQVHGGDVARVLSGKAFRIECVDGTHGRGQFDTHGLISVSYRRPNARNGTPEEFDLAKVRVRGVEICLSWKQFGGGGNGCYPVYEQRGKFRLGSGLVWCDISPK